MKNLGRDQIARLKSILFLLLLCDGIASLAPAALADHLEPYDILMHGTTTSSGHVLTMTQPKSGVKKPYIINDSYRQAICDVAHIMAVARSDRLDWHTVTINYDDGELSFECG